MPHSVPCLLTLGVLGVDGPWAFGQHDSRVKMHNLRIVLKTVITAVLTVTSSLKNSQNKWLPVILLIHDDDDDAIMMFNDYLILVYDHVG
jgi:hypothetical protein